MKKSILFSVLVVGATLLQAQSITVHQTCGQNGQVVEVQAVDLGLSVKWANMNVGAESPEDYGNYYAWGETSTKETYNWDTYFDTNYASYTCTKYNNEGGKAVLDLEDDAAHVNWGGSWRMPTKAEWQELYDNCTWTWTTQNGINGYKVTSNKAGYTDKFIFLPAAGNRYDSDLSSVVGSYGTYWSSSLYENYLFHAWELIFGSDVRNLVNSERYFGLSVRPVLQPSSISYSSSTNDTIRIYSNGCDEYQTFIGSHGGQLTMTANSDQWSHFVRWQDGNTDNPRTITTNGNADYTAYFETIIKYFITWQDEDGNPIKVDDVAYGETPVYTGETPTKPADAQYTYTFAGWDKEVVAVTGDATDTAVFVSVVQCGTIETTDGITVWEDQLPYTWEGISFTTAGTETKTLQASDGCDSIVTFTLRVLYRNITLQENEAADFYTQFANDYNGVTVTTATLNRQFTQGKWATLCLPFNVNKALMTALGLYNRVFEFRYAQQLDDETIQMYFAPAQTLEAGKGYIVNANTKLAQKTSFVFPNVTINTDSDNGDITALTGYNDGTGRGNLYLVGTLRTGMLQGSTTGNTYLGLKDNQLYYPNTTSGTSIRAYRGFFRSDVPVNASRVRIIADGESVTELEVMNGEEDLQETLPARKYLRNGLLFIEHNGITYTAQGQRID